MNVFDLRDHLIQEYKSYITRFLQIKDKAIRHFVDSQIAEGQRWPEP